MDTTCNMILMIKGEDEMDDHKKLRKISWIKLLWIPVIVGLIVLTFEKFVFDPLVEKRSSPSEANSTANESQNNNPKPDTVAEKKEDETKPFQKIELNFEEGEALSLEDFGMKPGKGAWLLIEESHPKSMDSYTDWSKNDVILIQATKEWDAKITPTMLEQIDEETYQIGYGMVELPEFDSNNRRIMAGSKLDKYYQNHYQKWHTVGRCFMIVPKGSVDFSKRIMIYRPNGKLDYDSHKQPIEGEEF